MRPDSSVSFRMLRNAVKRVYFNAMCSTEISIVIISLREKSTCILENNLVVY